MIEKDDALAMVMAQPGGARAITYREITIMAPMNDINEGVKMMTEAGRNKRRGIIKSISRSLEANYAAVAAGAATTKTAMEFGQDAVLWFANEVVEGRQTIHMN